MFSYGKCEIRYKYCGRLKLGFKGERLCIFGLFRVLICVCEECSEEMLLYFLFGKENPILTKLEQASRIQLNTIRLWI